MGPQLNASRWADSDEQNEVLIEVPSIERRREPQQVWAGKKAATGQGCSEATGAAGVVPRKMRS